MNTNGTKKVLMLASVASMIGQFNMPNIRLLQKMGYEVHVACNFLEGNTCDRIQVGKIRRELKRMHVAYHQWDCPRSIQNAMMCVRAYRQLLELTECHAFVWMHCHSPIGGALARAVAHQKNITIIYTAHGFHFYQGAPLKNWLFYYPVEKLLSYWTDILVTVNREDYVFAKRYLKAKKVCWIPGVGIDTKRFAKLCTESEHFAFCEKNHIPRDAIVLLSVGELNKGKNHQAVLKAIDCLQRKHRPECSSVYYFICGKGNLRKRLMRDARRMGISGQLRMLGYQENMPWIYRNADIFVFPSMREGMPAALMEAMAAGLPCVVSDIRGNRELIDENGGILFSRNSQKQLTRALERVIEDKQFRRMAGIYNKKKIKSCDSAIVDQRMKKIYEICEFYAGIRINSTIPAVSVLMGVHGERKEDVCASIDSVLNQSYQDFELIICVDGADREYDKWLQEYCSKDARIHLLRNKKNRGLAYTLNRCLDAARGKYAARMDADDISMPKRLERQILFLEGHKEYALAGCNASLIDDGGVWGIRKMETVPEKKSFVKTSPFIHPSIVMRMDVLRQLGGYSEKKEALRAEDYDLFMRMYEKGYRGYNLQEILLGYREDRDSYTKRKYRYRMHECKVRYRGFRNLGILRGNIRYVIKPLLVGLVPASMMQKYRRKKYRI